MTLDLNRQIRCNLAIVGIRRIYLSEIDGQVDLGVLQSSGHWRTLPPVGRSIDGVRGRMTLRTAHIARVANLHANQLTLLEFLCLHVTRLFNAN